MVTKLITSTFIEKPLRTINKEYSKSLVKYNKKNFHPKEINFSEELNTFLLNYTEFDSVTAEEIINYEKNFLTKSISYHEKNIIKLLRKNIQNNKEIKETGKIVKNFIKIIDASLSKDFSNKIDKLHQDLPTILSKKISQNSIFLWSLDDNSSLRLNLNGQNAIVLESKDINSNIQDIDIISMIDKLIMFNFYSSWSQYTIKFLKDLNKTLGKIELFFNNHIKLHIADRKIKKKLVLFLRILVAKLSALEQSDNVLTRIFELNTKLQKKINEIPVSLIQDLNIEERLREQKNEVVEALKLLRSIHEKIGLCKIHLIEYSKTIDAEPSLNYKDELSDFAKLSVDLFVESEKIKLWTDEFLDIPYFTFSSELFTEVTNQKNLEAIDIESDVIISARGLFKTYNLGATTVYAIRGMSIDIKTDEFLVIFGASGAGKTTLLNCISGLDTPDRGKVFFRGEDLSFLNDKKRSKSRLLEMGFIFQNYALLPHYTAKENITLPSDLAGLSKDLKIRINDLLEGVGINLQAKQFPSQLSGGQMQRVGIARALTNNPTIIFADEPTGDLDSETGKQVMDLLKRFQEETNTTVVVISHDKAVAEYATRVINLHDGVIVE